MAVLGTVVVEVVLEEVEVRGSGSNVTTYTLDISAIPSKVAADESNSPYVIDSTISVVATATGKSIAGKGTYVQMTSGKASATSGSEYGLKITLLNSANISITALSKESKAACQWNLTGDSTIASTGTPAVAAAKSDVTTTAPAQLTFASVPAGTYYLGAASDGGYLCSLTINYN